MIDNTAMIQDAVRDINEGSEKSARLRIKHTIANIIEQQKFIALAVKRISELKKDLKEISYTETNAEEVS